MKTTDLIPIILYQLVDGDKYGYEIVKQIEDISNGGIIIKQPTLYSVLKKLEQGKFISSYWQDSEIGGKRHYYKLTDNGRAQLSTYPTLDILIKDAVDDEVVSVETKPDPTPLQSEKMVDRFDEIEVVPSPIDLTLNIENNIKQQELDINLSLDNNDSTENATPLFELNKEENNNQSETSFASIFDVMEYNSSSLPQTEESEQITNNILSIDNEDKNIKFTEKVEPITEPSPINRLYDKLTPNTDLISQVEEGRFNPNPDMSATTQIEEIKFLNYVDLQTDKTVIKRRKSISKHIQKMSLTCISLLLMFITSLIVCSKYSFSKPYYISAIIVCLILVFYPITLLSNISKIRFKYCSKPFKYYKKQDFFIKFSLLLSLIIVVFAYNLTVTTNIKMIFELNNFASFYAPIMFGLIFILDFMYSSIIYKSYTK